MEWLKKKVMATFLSESDGFGDCRFLNRYLLSPYRSVFPTSCLGFFDDNHGGFFLLRFFNGSFTIPLLSEDNFHKKPPWPNLYNFHKSQLPYSFSVPQFNENENTERMSDNLRKSIQDLDLGIDDSPVPISKDFCSRAASINRYSLIVSTVNPKKQNLRAMISQMPRVWGFPKSCYGRILGNGKAQFLFQSETAMNLVLSRGPWSFNDWMVTVHRWYPNITEAEMKILPFWVQIRGIPLLYVSNDMARAVGNHLGEVAEVDFDEKASMVEFLRVQMKWNIDAPLRFRRNFQFDPEINTMVQFRFERLRNFCTRCGSLKHDIKDCELVFHEGPPPVSSDDDSGDDNDKDLDNNGNESEDLGTEDTLETIDPYGQIPGLQMSQQDHNSARKETDNESIPSVFEDTELTAERLRYLHAKLMNQVDGDNEKEFLPNGSAVKFVIPQQKRKRFESEAMYQQAEAAEDKAVLSHIRKRERHTESQGSTSPIIGGAGGPVPPMPP